MKKLELYFIAFLLGVSLCACTPKEEVAPPIAVEEAPPITITVPDQVITDPPCCEAPTLGTRERTDAFFGVFSATSLAGNEYNEELFHNSTLTMLNIWGTFCSPCLNEMPDLALLNNEFKDRGLQVVGIVIDTLDRNMQIDTGQVALAKQLVLETGADYLHLLPSESLINIKLADVSAIPETIFIDSAGNVLGEPYIGSRDKGQWALIIEEKLKEATA